MNLREKEMRVNQLKRFLMTCSPMSSIGVTVQTKQGPQFWDFDAGAMSIFKAPDGKKCVSVMDIRVNDPLPEGAIVEGLAVPVDDAPISPDALMQTLDEKFNIQSKEMTKEKVLKMTTDELQSILFDVIHNEIADLIKINNDLLVYVKNRYKFQNEYWIDVKRKEA